MSYHEYVIGREVAAKDYPFYALIMAAMRKADDINTEKLKGMWPEVYAELQERYNAPGGLIGGEESRSQAKRMDIQRGE